MATITNAVKEKHFRFPGRDFVGFGRKPACVQQGGALWIATQKEDAEGTTLLVVRDGGEERAEHIELPIGPLYHAATLIDRGRDTAPALAWNQFADGAWSIRFAELSDKPLSVGAPETVFTSERLCMPPDGVFCDGAIHLAWPAMDDACVRIRIAVRNAEGGWQIGEPVSSEAGDALRPSICAAGGSVHLFWDEYRDGRYRMAGAGRTKAGWQALEPAGQPDERWFCPNTAATVAGDVYVTWVSMKAVSDDRGIVDNQAIVMVGRLSGNRIEILEDTHGPAIADLREGLLAAKVSKGYLGLRRRPQLTVGADARLWCCWEVRIEEEGTAVSGHLAARSFDGSAWSEAMLLTDAGYGYMLPKRQEGSELAFGFYAFTEASLEIIRSGSVSAGAGRLYAPDPSRWAHWHDCNVGSLVKSNRTVDVDGVRHSMFWADTHCHSNFSADAEGEPDEIIHYARDIAGLDALCVIDNDFYPHKTLSPAEWQVHQENSRHFTKSGEFVLFPGYEFTFHRPDLRPDFNHRCVIYPGPEGELHRRIDPESDRDTTLPEALRGSGAMTYPHHCTYELMAPDLEWNVEVCSSWRVGLEECDFSIEQLRKGKRFGFIGSSDAHRSNPGMGGALTGLFAPELTREALFEAYRNRRIIATQGFAVFIDFRVAGVFIGSEGSVTEAPEVTAVVEAPEEIEYVRVLRDGVEIHRETPGGSICEFAFTDDGATPGRHFYFLNLKLVGDPGFNFEPDRNSRAPFTLQSRYPHNLAKARGVFAWTSPVWISTPA